MDNGFEMKCLREEIDENHALDLVTRVQESADIARERGGIARHDS